MRTLHIKESVECVNIPDNVVRRQHNNEFFSYELVDVFEERVCKAHQHGDYIVILEGIGKINDMECKAGDFIMISSQYAYHLYGNLIIQKTWF